MDPLTPTPVAAPSGLEEPRTPDPLAVSVASAIARLRREAGLSERAAARKLGTSQTQLRRMEDPRYLPSLRSISRVARAYGYRVEVSFSVLDEKKKPAPPVPRKAPVGEARTQRGIQKKRRARPVAKGRGARG